MRLSKDHSITQAGKLSFHDLMAENRRMVQQIVKRLMNKDICIQINAAFLNQTLQPHNIGTVSGVEKRSPKYGLWGLNSL